MIALDLITGALRLVGVSSPGEPVSAEDQQIGLDAFNGLLEDWSTQNLAIYTLIDAVYNLVASQASYTIGTAGNFNGVRPIQIEDLYVRYQSIDYPIEIITNADYNAIPYKSQAGPIPFVAQYDPGYPLGTITFWPVPNQILPVTLTANQQLTAIPLASTTLSLPPAYARALKYGLAMDLFAEYGRDPTANVTRIAALSRGNIKRANNVPPQEARFDDALTNGGGTRSQLANFIAGI